MENETKLTDESDNNVIANASTIADEYLANNIVEARTDHDKACEVYRNYVGKAETSEERLRRINMFRCGGW